MRCWAGGAHGCFQSLRGPSQMWEDRSDRALTTYKSQNTPSRRSCRGGRRVAHSPLHLPLVGQVRLVAHQHDDHIAAPLRPDIINPLRGLLEGVEIWRWKVGIKLGMRGGPVGEGRGSERESVHSPSDTWAGQVGAQTSKSGPS